MATADVEVAPQETGGGDQERPAKPRVMFAGEPSVGPVTTSGSASLMAPVKPISLRIYTIDNRPHEICFKTGKHTIAGQIVEQMMTLLNIPAELSNVFSVWLTSPYLQLQLKSYHTPVKLFKKWKEMLIQYTNYSHDVCAADEPILSLRRNAFLSLKDEKKLIAKKNSRLTITLLYQEAVYNVVSGRYPLSRDELVELAGLQCAAEKGEFNPELHTADTLRPQLRRFLPPHLPQATPVGGEKKRWLGVGSSGKAGSGGKGAGRRGSDGDTDKVVTIEGQVLDAYKSSCKRCSEGKKERKTSVENSAVAASLGKEEEERLWADRELQLQLLYLQRCWCKPFYGCVMFRGQVERKRTSNLKQLLVYSDRDVVVAINPECVHLFTDGAPREIMLYLAYDQLSWDFEPATEEGEHFYSSLWLEYDSVQGAQKVAKRLQIFSRQAPMMDAMISRCVGELNQRDEQLKKQRRQEGGPEELPPVTIKTDRSLPVQHNYLEHKLCCEVTPEGSPPATGPVSLLSRMRQRKSDGAINTTTTPSRSQQEDTHPLAVGIDPENTRLERSSN